MMPCYRVPIHPTETVTVITPGGGSVRPTKRTKVVGRNIAPVITASDALGARDRAQEMYPDAEIGKPVFLHINASHVDGGPRTATLDRVGYR